MGSEENEKKRNLQIISTSIILMPMRQKLAIVVIAIFVGAVLFIGSLHDFGKSDGLYFLMGDNDFSRAITPGVNENFNFSDILDEDYYFNLEEEATRAQLMRFRKTSILNRLTNVSSLESLNNGTTPQGMAFNFIAEIDKRSTHPDEDLLLQRYALAVLFFATQGNDWFYGNLHFLSSVQECHWHKKIHSSTIGVADCDANLHVKHLQLSGNNLKGTIPSEIKVFKRLEKLDLGNNKLEGTIPSEIGELKKLQFLGLNTNNFTGEVPATIGHLEKAEEILLQFNELEGAIPKSICNLKNESKLSNFWTDCASSTPPLLCECCTVCCNGFEDCSAL